MILNLLFSMNHESNVRILKTQQFENPNLEVKVMIFNLFQLLGTRPRTEPILSPRPECHKTEGDRSQK